MIINLLIIFFWAFHILQRIFYSLYIWQLKEYRLDRFKEELTRNRNVVFPKILFFAFLFLILIIFGYSGSLFFGALLGLYILVGVKSIYDLLKNRWRFPVLTKKMMVLMVLVFLVTALFFYSFSNNFPETIIIFEIILPLIMLVAVLLVQLPTFLIKGYIFNKARRKRNSFEDLIVIGITGSYGKSSTKEFIYTMLSQKYNVLKTEGNINTELGIAYTVLSKLNKNHQIFICEMGAYKRGEIKNSASIVKPQIGVLTGINQQHLALFGSQENIIKGKYELIESLPKDGMAFFNVKNDYCRQLYEKTTIKKELYGEKSEFLGEENVYAAVAVARFLKMDERDITNGFEKIKGKIGGLSTKKGINDLNILDASYSANPNGIFAHLEYIKNLPGKKIMVMPCLIELGDAAVEIHKKIGEKSKDVCDLLIVTTKDFYKEIKSGNPNTLFMNNSIQILDKIKEVAKPGDFILLESRVPEKLKRLLIK